MRAVGAVNKTMVHLDAIKIYSLNALAFLSTLTTIDTILKIALLVVSIIYTTVKILAVIKNDLKVKGIVEKNEEERVGAKGNKRKDKKNDEK